jgi:predicted enzyme related to lactoylglutathione lyase
MPETKTHEPGTFCWVDLTTTDPNAAKAFYGELFGWKTFDAPAGAHGVYTMLLVGDKEVAALASQPPDMQKMGIPPTWNSYVAVADVDAAAKKAASLGGKVLDQPFDVMDAGRMAVLQDPTGAVFMLWQGKRHHGAALREEPNTLCWNELHTHDPDAAKAFYDALFGWNGKSHGAHSYTEWERPGTKQPAGGMMKIGEHMGPHYQHIPSHWTVYFAVENVDAVADRALRLGGKVVAPPMDIPHVGRFAALQDPQGAMFSVIKLVPHQK